MLNVRSVLVALVALLIASPLSLGASAFSAATLSIDGSATVGGQAAALFVVAGNHSLAWDVSAAGVVVERTYAPFTRADPPATPGSRIGGFSYFDKPETRRETYGPSTLVGTDAREWGALLALVSASDFEVTASADALAIESAHDPVLVQGASPDIDTKSGSETGPDYRIHQTVPGDFLNITAPAGAFEIRGNLVLRLLDVDYSITSDNRTVEHRTGDVDTSSTAFVHQGQRETETLTLVGAVLRVRAVDPITLLSTSPVVSFSGTLLAEGAQGSLDLPTLSSPEPGRWTGSGTLDLAPQGGAVALVAPPPLHAAGSATVARAPEVLAMGAGILALLIVAAAVFALRVRRGRADDLDLAILAMEERRWDDALPHLDRLAAKRPDDAVVLMDRAICLEESGRLQEARAGYEATLRVEPHNAEAHYYYARTLARLRLGTAALAHLSRALALDARLGELARRESAFAGFSDHPLFQGLVR